MLGFVPTSQANFENRQNYSDRLRKTRRENAEEMQRLMAAAAEAGMEVTPEWLASQEATMLTPELMMMGISPREAITNQMMEASNKKAEQSRMQQELVGLNREKEFDSSLTELVGGWLNGGKSEQDIPADLAKNYPGMAANAIPRLPNILSRFKSEAATRALSDHRLQNAINFEDVPEDLRLPYLEQPLQALIRKNRNTVMDGVGVKLFGFIQASHGDPNIFELEARAKVELERQGVNFTDKDVKEAAKFAVDAWKADNNLNDRTNENAMLTKAFEYGVDRERRDEAAAADQVTQAKAVYQQTIVSMDTQADAYVKMAQAKGSGVKPELIPIVESVLRNYNLGDRAYAAFMDEVNKSGDVRKALENVKDRYPASVHDARDRRMDAEFVFDVTAGEKSPQEFGNKWSRKFVADRDRQLRELHDKRQNNQASRDPALDRAIHRQLDDRMTMIEQAVRAIRIPEIRSPYEPPRYVAGAPRGRGQQSQAIPAAAEQFAPIIIQAAQQNGVPVSWLMALAEVESGFKADAFNPENNDSGIFQFIPDTARRYGITDPFDPEQNIFAGARMFADHLAHGMRKFNGDPSMALEEAVRSHQAGMSGERRGERNQDHFEKVVAAQRKYAHLDGQQQRPQQQGWSRGEVPDAPTFDEAPVPVSVDTPTPNAPPQSRESWIRDSRGNIQLLQPFGKMDESFRGIEDAAIRMGAETERQRQNQGW